MSGRRGPLSGLPLERLRELHAIVVSMNGDGREELGPIDEMDLEVALAELIQIRSPAPVHGSTDPVAA